MESDLDKLSVEQFGRLFPVTLTDYDPNWKNIFEKEKQRLIVTLQTDNIYRIEHIGSTAIPFIKSKPTIDILLEVNESTGNKSIIHSIKSMGYHYIPKPENPAPHMMFVKGYSKEGFVGQAYHIHVRYPGKWGEISFRNYLNKNPHLAKEYEKLKIKLAGKYKNNREAYTEGKTEFVNRINEYAMKSDYE